MKQLFKTEQQVEFSELFEKLDRNKWKQIQVAEALHLSRSAVSMYLKGGSSSPSERTLEDMRALVKKANTPEHPGDEQHDQVEEQLEYLKRHHPPSYEAAKAAVGALHHQATQGVSSKVASIAEGGAPSASVLARRELQESQRKPATGGPSGRKRGPKRGAPRESGNTPAAPK